MLARRFLMAVFAAGTWLAATLPLAALAAPMLTVTTTGTISAGAAGATNLTGLTATMVQTYVVTPTYLEFPGNPAQGVFDSVSVSVTIGASPMLSAAEPGGSGFVTVGTLDAGLGIAAQFGGQVFTRDADGNDWFAYASLFSFVSDFIATTDILTDRDFATSLGDAIASFGLVITGPGGDLVTDFFVETVTAFAVTFDPGTIAVPEPASIALLGLGLATVAVARLRRRRNF